MDNKSIAVSIDFLREQVRSLNETVEKIADSQLEMNKVLIENTVIVKEHERRSTAFEGWAVEANKTLRDVSFSVNRLHGEIIYVEKQLTPIQTHITKVTKIVNFLDGVPVTLKVIVLSGTVLSALYGVFIVIHTLIMSGK